MLRFPTLPARIRAPLLLSVALACTAAGAPSGTAPAGAVQDGPTVLHVATNGSDSNRGTADAPFKTVQRAVQDAAAGDTVLVHAGTYEGRVVIQTSGAPGRPLVLKAAGDGPVTLVTSDLKPVSCDSGSPAADRTIRIPGGDDHIVIQGFRIVGGIDVSGTNNDALQRHVKDRSLPGRGAYDPEAADRTLAELGSDAADSIRILDNVVERRGIDITNSRWGEIGRNEIRDIDCGTGGGIWLHRFDDKYHIHGNWVHDIAASPNHWVTEGIRIGSQSSYNLVERNTVERANGPGRGITSDVHASWNVYQYNVVRESDQGFSEQAGGWGNKWLYNVAENNRKFGYNVFQKGRKGGDGGGGERADGLGGKPGKTGKRRGGGIPAASDPDDGVPRSLVMRCNRSVGNRVDLNVGDTAQAVFANNDFQTISLSDKVRSAWTAQGNIWNGSSSPPPERSAETSVSSCGASPETPGSPLASAPGGRRPGPQ